MAALLKFTQGSVGGRSGEALIVEPGAAVTIENDSGVGVASWRVEMLTAPSTSNVDSAYRAAVPTAPLLVAQDAASSTVSTTITPDVAGCYRLRLTTWSGPSYSGTEESDIRNVCVLDARGNVIPPYQDDPPPIDSKPDELNFNNQPFGWAGSTGVPATALAVSSRETSRRTPPATLADPGTSLRYQRWGLIGPRAMTTDDQGNLWFSQMEGGGGGSYGVVCRNTRTDEWEDFVTMFTQDGTERDLISMVHAKDRLWVLDNNTVQSTIWRYNTKTREDPDQITVTLGTSSGSGHNRSIAYGNNHLFVPTNGLSGSNYVVRLDISDPTTSTPTQINLGPVPADDLRAVAYDAERDRLWVSGYLSAGTAALWYVDSATTGAPSGPIPVPIAYSLSLSGAWGVIMAAGSVWLAAADAGQIHVYRVDPATATQIADIPMGFGQSTWLDLAYDPQNDVIYVNSGQSGSNQVRRIDVRTNSVLGSGLTLSSQSFRVHWNNGYVYANYQSGSSPSSSRIWKINPRTWAVEETWQGDTVDIKVLKRERTVVITDATPTPYILPDDTGLVVVNVSSGTPRVVYLPPETRSPQSDSGSNTRPRADGARVRFVDVSGGVNIGVPGSEFIIQGYQGDFIMAGERQVTGNFPSPTYALKPFSSVTFRQSMHPDIAPFTGGAVWLVEADSEQWVTYNNYTPGQTLPMGKSIIPCLLADSGFYLPDARVWGDSTSTPLEGTEIIVKAINGPVTILGGPMMIDGQYEYVVERGGWVHLAYTGNAQKYTSSYTVLSASPKPRPKRTGRKRPYRLTTPRSWARDGDGNLWFNSLGGGRGFDVPGFWRINEYGDGIDEVVTLRGQQADGWVERANGSDRYLNGLAYQNGYLWAIDYANGELVGFNPRTYDVVSGSTVDGTNPRKIVAGRNNYLYVANDSINTIQRYDVSDPTSIVKTVSIAAGGVPWAIEYDPVRDRIWISLESVGVQYMGATTMAFGPVTNLTGLNLTKANNLIYTPMGSNSSQRDYIWLAGERTSDGNLGLWRIIAETGGYDTARDTGVAYPSSPEYVDLSYDASRDQFWVSTGTTLQAWTANSSSPVNVISPANPPHRVFSYKGKVWTSWFGGGGSENAEVSRYDPEFGSTDLTIDQDDQFEIDEPTRSCVIDSDTPSQVILSDEVDHVFIDLSDVFSGSREIFLPPLRGDAAVNQGYAEGAYDLLDGYEVTFIDVNGTVGKPTTTVTITAQDSEKIYHANDLAAGPQTSYEFRDAHGAITFKWDRNPDSPAIGRWLVKQSDRNWVTDTTAAVPPITARKGRVRHFTRTGAVGGSITIPPGKSGDEIIIKDDAATFRANPLSIAFTGGATLDGSGSSFTLRADYQSLHIACKGGTEWFRVAETGDGLVRVASYDNVPNYLLNKLRSSLGLLWTADGISGFEYVVFAYNASDAMPIYLWDPATSGAPATGRIAANITSPPDTLNAITEFRIHVNSRNGSMSLWELFRRMRVGDLMQTQIAVGGVTTNYGGVFRLTSLAVPDSLPTPTYVTFQVTPLVTTGTPYNNGNGVAVAFYQVGQHDDQITADALTVDPTPNYTPTETGGSAYWDTARIISLSNGALTTPTVSGFVAVTAGAKVKKLTNRGTSGIVLTHNDAGSAAANQFQIPGGGSLTLQPDDVVDVTYDTNISKWRVG